jgi:peptidoglycan hydrolase-like protein with peptidoglycan-binding domain
MDNKAIQRLLAASGYYSGGIDGVLGTKSLKAIATILDRHRFICTSNPDKWVAKRRAIGAAQLILKFAGYNPGAIDGYWGVNTEEALRAWDYKQATGKAEVVTRAPVPTYTPPASGVTRWPKQSECSKFYGTPGTNALTSQLRSYTLPLAMRIDWNLSQRTTKVQLHAKCGDSAMRAMEQIVRHYGEARWRKLGLDRNAGTYNHRKMRGGTSWSMHAYGCAWDFYAGPNGLRVPAPQALFSGEEYKPFFDIWESEGWTSLGRAINRDWMHVQAAYL